MIFRSQEDKLKKMIAKREKKLAALKKNEELYKKIGEQQKQYNDIINSPAMKDYVKAQQKVQEKRIETNKKMKSILDIITKHMLAEDEPPKKPDDKK